jgi:hypothetical protein
MVEHLLCPVTKQDCPKPEECKVNAALLPQSAYSPVGYVCEAIRRIGMVERAKKVARYE